MVKHRFFISLLTTIVLYALMGLLFFYVFPEIIGTAHKPQEKIITISMSEYVPEVTPPVEAPAEESVEPMPQKPVIEETKPEEPVMQEVIPEPIKPKLIPQPVVKKIVQKKVIKKVKKKVMKKKRVKKKTLKKRVTKRKTTAKKTSHKKRASKTQASPAKKNSVLNQLRAMINKNKTYPRIAQRRGMQGVVKARFTILSNGKVGTISLRGKKVFYKSARKAIERAFPINVKNAPLSLPTTVNLTLRYQIR